MSTSFIDELETLEPDYGEKLGKDDLRFQDMPTGQIFTRSDKTPFIKIEVGASHWLGNVKTLQAHKDLQSHWEQTQEVYKKNVLKFNENDKSGFYDIYDRDFQSIPSYPTIVGVAGATYGLWKWDTSSTSNVQEAEEPNPFAQYGDRIMDMYNTNPDYAQQAVDATRPDKFQQIVNNYNREHAKNLKWTDLLASMYSSLARHGVQYFKRDKLAFSRNKEVQALRREHPVPEIAKIMPNAMANAMGNANDHDPRFMAQLKYLAARFGPAIGTFAYNGIVGSGTRYRNPEHWSDTEDRGKRQKVREDAVSRWKDLRNSGLDIIPSGPFYQKHSSLPIFGNAIDDIYQSLNYYAGRAPLNRTEILKQEHNIQKPKPKTEL